MSVASHTGRVAILPIADRHQAPWRSLWQNIDLPRIAIIITHYNYSDFLGDCISSVLGQSYDKVDLIVVDDCSKPEHLDRASQIVNALPAGKAKLVANRENAGQVTSFFNGLNETDADFVVLLDPDDRLHPDFCREMLAVHLNGEIYCGQASCNQAFVRDNVILTGTCGHRMPGDQDIYRVDLEYNATFVGPYLRGWHWPSTSSLVFRRDAVELLRPKKALQSKRAADTYFAPLIHMLGGSLYYSKPLVLRSFHTGNSWLPERIVSRPATQNGRQKAGELARVEALDAFFSNNHSELLEANLLRATMMANLSKEQRQRLSSMHADVAELLKTKGSPRRRGPLRHWLRELRHGARARISQIQRGRGNT
jgi:glycosyltransferase involved in cell wall biosynthesis